MRATAAICLAAVLGTFVAFSLPSLLAKGQHSPVSDPNDFRAFYCAGAAYGRGLDPYLTEPLRACEQAAAASFGLHLPAASVTPAPLPPFALAWFSLFARLPFPAASLAWFGLLLAATAATAVLLRMLTGLPALGIVAALVFPEAFVSLNEGQIAPLVVCALCAAAVALRAQRLVGAALLTAAALIEPHIAVPALVSLFAFVPRARVPLLCCAGGIAAITFASGGFHASAEYATRVLPLHARSELDQLGVQYSLSSFLWAAGLVPTAAVWLGTASYAVMLVAGVVLARRAASASGDEAFIVLLPPAAVLLGGAFIHLFQMAVAVPAALLAFARFPRARPVLFVALLGLALPVQLLLEMTPLRDAVRTPYAPTTVAAATATRASVSGEAPAEVAETAYDGSGSLARSGLQWAGAFAPKLPTWIALIALLWAIWIASRSRLAFRRAI